MNKKILFGIVIVLVIAMIAGACFLLTKQKTQKVYRVGILSGSDAFAAIIDSFKTKMTELGYIEGKNIVYDIQKLNADPAGYDQVTQKFAKDKVDMIFAFPTEPALSAKAAVQGTNIPVIFAHSGLEGSNLVESVRETGGNLTGTRFPGPDLIAKRLEFLVELAPKIKRVYVPYDKNYPLVLPALDALRPVAELNGVTLVELPVAAVDEMQADLEARNKKIDIGIDAVLLLPELLMQSPEGWTVLSGFAKEHKLVLVGSSDATLKTGSVFTYNVNPVDDGDLAAILADKVFKGIPASTIPVVTPEAYLRINYTVVQELGLTAPQSLLNRASEIIH